MGYRKIKSPYKCAFCDEPIEDGEKYIENQYLERIHDDCDYNVAWMVDWLGGEYGTINLEGELIDEEYERYSSFNEE